MQGGVGTRGALCSSKPLPRNIIAPHTGEALGVRQPATGPCARVHGVTYLPRALPLPDFSVGLAVLPGSCLGTLFPPIV